MSSYALPRGLLGPRALINLYRRRLRVQGVQELLAGVGVAVAVALVFATLVASASTAGSAKGVIQTVTGPATLQLRALDSDGFSEGLLGRVERLPGVKRAAPLLEATTSVAAASGRRATVTVVGTDISLAILDGLAHTLPISTLASHSVGLSSTTARALGISAPGRQVRDAPVVLDLRGTSSHVKVATVLGPGAIGAISQAFAVVMRLTELQRIAGLRGRVSRVFVQADPGDEAAVKAALRTVAAGRLAVAASDQDVGLLDEALGPSGLASSLFAVIATLLGFLFAFNALLLTTPQRRQAIADFRLGGARRSAMVQLVLTQALMLGVISSVVGALGGYVLATMVFSHTPGYLQQAFTLGGATVIGVTPVAIAVGGGVLATCLAAAVPLLDLRRGRALDAVYSEQGELGNWLDWRIRSRLSTGAGVLLAFATILFLAWPRLALLGAGCLALSSVLAVPAVFGVVLRSGRALVGRFERLTSLSVALRALQATTLRSLALVATGAVALFGAVALGGARGDLLRGIEGYIHGFTGHAAVWVVNIGDPTAVDEMPQRYAGSLLRAPGVASVRAFQDSFLNIDGRRTWVLARPPGTVRELLEGQVVDGNLAAAAPRVEAGGWMTVSSQIAAEHHVSIGDTFPLATPTGTADMRVAALTTNLTWSPGAIVMSTAAYQRAWATAAPTALAITLAPGAGVAGALPGIRQALGPTAGVELLTPAARAARTVAVGREGLGQLAEICTLLVIAAVLAMAAALTSAIWQRRPSLAGLRLAGVPTARLRRTLLAEVALTVGSGCLVGVIAGVYGQLIVDSYLRHASGFPVASAFGSWYAPEVLGLVVGAALALAVIPIWLASKVPRGWP